MKVLACTTIAVIAMALASVANADNYGRVSRATINQVNQLVYREFGHNWRAEAIIRCIRRESGHNAKAANWGDSHGGSFGLAQINGIHAPGGHAYPAWIRKMWDPVENLKAAHALMRGAGLGPWGGGC